MRWRRTRGLRPSLAIDTIMIAGIKAGQSNMGVALNHSSKNSSRAKSLFSGVASIAILLAFALPAIAQTPSMLGAPGLSPIQSETPAAPAVGVVAPPAMSAQPSAPSAGGLDCQNDMVKFQARRNSAVAQINQIAGKGKKIDPVAACPRFRNLAAVEGQMKAWMLKNKDWCSIPDDVIDSMKAGFARTPVIVGQACNAAAQVGRMKAQARQQQQQARTGAPQQPGIKLPSGPL